MKVTLPDTAINTLKDILNSSEDKPKNIRVYFAGVGCGGPSFGIALDEQTANDVEYDIEGLHFIMDAKEYSEYGDIAIEDTGFGFRVIPENMKGQGGCGGGCSGCNH